MNIDRLRDLIQSPIRDALVYVLVTLFGIFVAPVLELITPPLFSAANLPSIIFVIIGIFSIISVSLWKLTQRNSQVIAAELKKIAEEVGQDARLVSYERAYEQLAEWARNAQHEIRVLTFYGRGGRFYNFDSKRLASKEREEWFQAAKEAILRTQNSNLRFIRIIQLTPSDGTNEPTSDDEVWFSQHVTSEVLNYEQVKLLSQFNQEAPQKACLRLARVYVHNTFVIIDGKHLFLNIDVWDENLGEYKSPSVLIATDTSGKRFTHLEDIHREIEQRSRLALIIT